MCVVDGFKVEQHLQQIESVVIKHATRLKWKTRAKTAGLG